MNGTSLCWYFKVLWSWFRPGSDLGPVSDGRITVASAQTDIVYSHCFTVISETAETRTETGLDLD